MWIVFRFLVIAGLALSVSAGNCLSGDTTPFQNWRNSAYQALLSHYQLRNVNNIKFLFLNDITPCVYRTGDGRELHGYGGLVAVRQHKLFWMHNNETMFFLLDSSGALSKVVSMWDLEQDTVSPQIVTVERKEVEEWVDGGYTREYQSVYNSKKDTYEWEWVEVKAPGYWETVIRKSVTPHIDQQTITQRNQFFKTAIKNLPNCQ